MRRILFVSHYYSHDFSKMVGGAFQRMRMLLDAAAAASDALDILFFVEPSILEVRDPASVAASLRAHWGIEARVFFAARATARRGKFGPVLAAAQSIRDQPEFYKTGGAAQANAVSDHVFEDTDLVFCHQLHVTLAAVRAELVIPIVVDLDGVEHVAFMRRLTRPPRTRHQVAGLLQLPAMFFGELATLKACDTVFVSGPQDVAYLARRAPSLRVRLMSNAVAFADGVDGIDPPTLPDANALLFVGTYGYEPNIEAAESLINEVFPIVRKARPYARLMIVGSPIDKLPSFGKSLPGVELLGFVPNLDEVYRETAVVACPIRTGGGTRTKIIEAAARRKAVVSTNIGAEGLLLENDREIVLRDGVQDFAKACIELLDDPQRAATIGESAYMKTIPNYDRRAVVARIAESLREAASR